MRNRNIIVVAVALASASGCAGLERMRNSRTTQPEERRPADESVVGPSAESLDTQDGAMRYQVSRVDMALGDVVLVASESQDTELDPQAGRELRIGFQEFRRLVGQEDPTLGDVIQALEEGGEVIVHGVGTAPPASADEIQRIELVEPE